jgi:hypothetical protein
MGAELLARRVPPDGRKIETTEEVTLPREPPFLEYVGGSVSDVFREPDSVFEPILVFVFVIVSDEGVDFDNSEVKDRVVALLEDKRPKPVDGGNEVEAGV